MDNWKTVTVGGEKFHSLHIKETIPRLKRWNVDVVADGPSLHDENTYYVPL